MSIVRENLLTRFGYTPHCGKVNGCAYSMPRTAFDGAQFVCRCGWQSTFEPEFIEQYKAAQAKLKAGLDAHPVTCPPDGLASPPAYEVVYFRRNPREAEDSLRVPVGTAEKHIRAELITRIEPTRGVQGDANGK